MIRSASSRRFERLWDASGVSCLRYPVTSWAAAQYGGVFRPGGIEPALVDEVFMGCVLPAGQGQAPARQAARGGGLPDATGATTVNKVCASGMKSVMLGHDLVVAGSARVVIAGGMESMSGAPTC